MANDTLKVRITGEDAGFKRAMDGVQSKVKQVQPHIEKSATAITGIGSALGGTGTKAGQAVGALSNVAQLLMVSGPLGAAIAAATILISKIAEAWSDAQQAAEDYEKAQREMILAPMKAGKDLSKQLRERIGMFGKDEYQRIEIEQRREMERQERRAENIRAAHKEEFADLERLQALQKKGRLNTLDAEPVQKRIKELTKALVPVNKEINEAIEARETALKNIGMILEVERRTLEKKAEDERKRAAEELRKRRLEQSEIGTYTALGEAETNKAARDASGAGTLGALLKLEDMKTEAIKQKEKERAEWIAETKQLFRDQEREAELAYLNEVDDNKRRSAEMEREQIEKTALKKQADHEKELRRIEEESRRKREEAATYMVQATQMAGQYLSEFVALQVKLSHARKMGDQKAVNELQSIQKQMLKQVLVDTMNQLSQIAIGKGAIMVIEGAGMTSNALTRASGIANIAAGSALLGLGLGGMAGAAGVAAKFAGSSATPQLKDINEQTPSESLDIGAKEQSQGTVEYHYHFEGPVFSNADDAARQVAKLNKRGQMLGAA